MRQPSGMLSDLKQWLQQSLKCIAHLISGYETKKFSHPLFKLANCSDFSFVAISLTVHYAER